MFLYRFIELLFYFSTYKLVDIGDITIRRKVPISIKPSISGIPIYNGRENVTGTPCLNSLSHSTACPFPNLFLPGPLFVGRNARHLFSRNSKIRLELERSKGKRILGLLCTNMVIVCPSSGAVSAPNIN